MPPASPLPATVVHVVAKTHLDLGFTALAAEVEARYLTEFFPRAIREAGELRARGSGSPGLVWTTGSWILHRALADPDRSRAEAVAQAVGRGDLAWHALPVTSHTELMDAGLVRSALGISAELDARFGVQTTAAKMTDVPGHTRGLVPLLAEAGVTFLHLGVNPAWPVPDVPAVFRWRSPDGAEVTVAYQAGGYGGEVALPGCTHVLAFLHAGDNLGPPSANEVAAAHADLAARYPGAVVQASTLDAFARALVASGAAAALPVVTAEIGDPWLFGAGSDPQKLAAYRELLRGERGTEVDRRLLLVAEHTWGLDQKEALPDAVRWDRAGLAQVRSSPEGARFEASWAEQRAYVGLPPSTAAPTTAPAPTTPAGPTPRTGWGSAAQGQRFPTQFEVGRWAVEVDADTGALIGATDGRSGRVLADARHPLGGLTYQSFGEADYERFYAQLTPAPDDEWWARWDNTKPGIDAAGAVSGRWSPEVVDVAVDGGDLVLGLRFPEIACSLGAPTEAWAVWRADADGALTLVTGWDHKPANRLPEATWCSFVPLVLEPERWELDKLGQRVSPLDVVRRGGRSLHGVGEGMHHAGPDGTLVIATPDAPLVAPGAPNLLDADPPLPDLAGGFHVLLHDNCWGTNFPMWNEGAARFRFSLRVS